MKLIPLWDRVAIKRMEKVNGIVIPASVDTQDSMGRGIVYAIGEGVRKVRVDDEVYFSHPIDLVSFEGHVYVLVTENLVVAKVSE